MARKASPPTFADLLLILSARRCSPPWTEQDSYSCLIGRTTGSLSMTLHYSPPSPAANWVRSISRTAIRTFQVPEAFPTHPRPSLTPADICTLPIKIECWDGRAPRDSSTASRQTWYWDSPISTRRAVISWDLSHVVPESLVAGNKRTPRNQTGARRLCARRKASLLMTLETCSSPTPTTAAS